MNQFIKGFSLLEFLVASALSLILMGVLMKLLIYAKAAEQTQVAWIKLSQEAYYVSSYLLTHLATVGSARCDPALKPDCWVRGYSFGHYPGFITQKEKVQGDVLVVTRCEEQKFRQYAYYVAKTNRHNAKGKAVFALYEKPVGSNRLELEEGIQALQVDYALRSENQTLVYYSANQLNAWDKVIALNLHFTLSSDSASAVSIQKPWGLYVFLRSR